MKEGGVIGVGSRGREGSREGVAGRRDRGAGERGRDSRGGVEGEGGI